MLQLNSGSYIQINFKKIPILMGISEVRHAMVFPWVVKQSW